MFSHTRNSKRKKIISKLDKQSLKRENPSMRNFLARIEFENWELAKFTI